MRVGYAGLGRLPTPEARGFAAAGFSLTVWKRTEAEATVLATEIGCEVADCSCALAERCEVVFMMLADETSSEMVHFGESGIFAAQTLALQQVEMGTMSPDHIAALAAAAPEDIAVTDAAVSTATQAARQDIKSFRRKTEQYCMLVNPSSEVLATTTFSGNHMWWIEGNVIPIVLKRRRDKGRVCYCSIGHELDGLKVAQVTEIIRRGALWTARGGDEDQSKH
jgi:hypothetical protein